MAPILMMGRNQASEGPSAFSATEIGAGSFNCF